MPAARSPGPVAGWCCGPDVCGAGRRGETLNVPLEGGEVMQATVVDPVFYDKEGARRNV